MRPKSTDLSTFPGLREWLENGEDTGAHETPWSGTCLQHVEYPSKLVYAPHPTACGMLAAMEACDDEQEAETE